MFPADTVLEEVIQVAETPGDKAEAGDAEKSVEDLGVDLDPDAARRIEIVAVFDAVQVGGVAHVLAAAADEEQKQHPAPGDDVEPVKNHKEAEGCYGEFPEAFEGDDCGFAPGMFGREFVAIGVDAFGVGTYG